jgi:tetrahydromethanopterin S-methyltransferase subunit G
MIENKIELQQLKIEEIDKQMNFYIKEVSELKERLDRIEKKLN